MHLILVDNGRTKQLAREKFRNSLKCIRCGACMNTCPVYRRSGGHSYHSAIAGPIGAILTPNLDMKRYADLPFASTLCGSCTNVCPVKIDIHSQLYQWRQEIVRSGLASPQKTLSMKVMSGVLSKPGMFRFVGRLVRWLVRSNSSILNHSSNTWIRQRDLPDAPKESFQEWYKKNVTK